MNEHGRCERLPASATLPVVRPRCQATHGVWPTDAGNKVSRLAETKGSTRVFDRDALAQLLRQPGKDKCRWTQR